MDDLNYGFVKSQSVSNFLKIAFTKIGSYLALKPVFCCPPCNSFREIEIENLTVVPYDAEGERGGGTYDCLFSSGGYCRIYHIFTTSGAESSVFSLE